jgi:drug/metabolite transporter (DMT)-like permease
VGVSAKTRTGAIGSGALAALVAGLIFVVLWPDPDRLTSTGAVLAGVLFWIETIAVAAWVAASRWPRDEHHDPAERLGGLALAMMMIGMPLLAWVLRLVSGDREMPTWSASSFAVRSRRRPASARGRALRGRDSRARDAHHCRSALRVFT